MADSNAKDFLGKGFQFPIEVDEVNGHFKMSQGEQSICESIKVILMTSKGERMMRPEFGCNLKRYVYESMNYTTLKSIEEEVTDALNQWEPRIMNVEVIVSPAHETGRLDIHISYRVRVTNNPYNLVFPFYLQEGFQK